MPFHIFVFSVGLHFVYNERVSCGTWSLPIPANIASWLVSGSFLCLPLLGLQAAAPLIHPFTWVLAICTLASAFSSELSPQCLVAFLLDQRLPCLVFYFFLTFVCLCVREGAFTYMWLHICGGQRSALGVVPQELFTLLFETKSLPGPWGTLVRLDWLTKEPQGSTCLYLSPQS